MESIMATSNVAIAAVIGGVVGASFGKALFDSKAKINAFKKNAERVRGFRNLIGDTIRLRQEMQNTADKSSNAFAKLSRSNDANITKLKAHGIAVDKLDKEYTRLGRTVKGLELGAAGRQNIGEGVQSLKSGFRTVAAAISAVAVPTMVSANYQSIIRDIAIKGGIARTDKEDALSESIRRDAADSGIERNELAEAVNTLVAGGMDVAEAAANARSIARFSVGQNADSTDTARLVLAMRQAGITNPESIEKALGKVAVAGDLGSFEAKDMAKHFASLMPQMTAFGMAGEQATVELANMLQTQMKAAGSANEAAINLSNLLSKLTSEDTKNKFADKGIDFTKSMRFNIAQGYDPIMAFLGIAQEAANKTDPAKAEELAALQEQIAKAQDPIAAQKMLDSYLEMAGLSEYISDKQAKQAALAALQNQNLHRANLKTIQETDGLAKTEKDLADRRAASAQMWREVGQAMDDALLSIGDAIQPLTDWAASMLKSVGETISSLSKEFPMIVNGIVAASVAFGAALGALALGKIAVGSAQVVRGAWNIFSGGQMPVMGSARRRGRGGKAGMIADALGAATGASGTPVFVTNWPGGGLLDGTPGGGKTGNTSAKAGKPGVLSRARSAIGTVATGAIGAGKVALAAPSMAAIAAGGAGTMAAGAGMVAASGAAGYAFGSLINAGINMAISATSGRESSLGTWLYEKLHSEEAAKAAALEKPSSSNLRQAPQQSLAFSPTVNLTVMGDAKDPRQLANDMIPYLKRMLEDFQRQASRNAFYDTAPQ
jgi:hypothetical protein